MHGVTGTLTGTGADDNDVLFTSPDITAYNVFTFVGTAGAADVEVTIDGENWTAAVSLTDLGATSAAPVVVMASDRLYMLRGKFQKIRVLQNGATAATYTMRYGVM